MLGQCVQVFGACDGVSLATDVPSPRTFNGIVVASASLGAGVFKAAMHGMSSCVGVPFTTAAARLERCLDFWRAPPDWGHRDDEVRRDKGEKFQAICLDVSKRIHRYTHPILPVSSYGQRLLRSASQGVSLGKPARRQCGELRPEGADASVPLETIGFPWLLPRFPPWRNFWQDAALEFIAATIVTESSAKHFAMRV